MTTGRPPAHSRDDILERGMELFNRQGYHGTGIKEILDSCQVSKGSFYNFFGSKEAFAIEIIAHYQELEFGSWHERLQEQDGCYADKIRSIIEADIATDHDQCIRLGSLLANMSAEMGNASPSFRAAILDATDKVIDEITEDMKICQQEGSVRQDIAPRQLARMIWNYWQGALLRMQVENSVTPLLETTNMLWDHILPAPPVQQ